MSLAHANPFAALAEDEPGIVEPTPCQTPQQAQQPPPSPIKTKRVVIPAEPLPIVVTMPMMVEDVRRAILNHYIEVSQQEFHASQLQDTVLDIVYRKSALRAILHHLLQDEFLVEGRQGWYRVNA